VHPTQSRRPPRRQPRIRTRKPPSRSGGAGHLQQPSRRSRAHRRTDRPLNHVRVHLDTGACNPAGFVPAGVRFGLTGRGRAGAEDDVAGEAGCGIGARLDDGSHTSSAMSRPAWPTSVSGLRRKQLTAALQVEMVPAQVIRVGELSRSCVACGCALAGKGHYGATCRFGFRSLLGCPCQHSGGAKTFAALNLRRRLWRLNWHI
jgi:hypothetical protein